MWQTERNLAKPVSLCVPLFLGGSAIICLAHVCFFNLPVNYLLSLWNPTPLPPSSLPIMAYKSQLTNLFSGLITLWYPYVYIYTTFWTIFPVKLSHADLTISPASEFRKERIFFASPLSYLTFLFFLVTHGDYKPLKTRKHLYHSFCFHCYLSQCCPGCIFIFGEWMSMSEFRVETI